MAMVDVASGGLQPRVRVDDGRLYVHPSSTFSAVLLSMLNLFRTVDPQSTRPACLAAAAAID